MLAKCFDENGKINNEEFRLLAQEYRGKIVAYSRNFFIPGGDWNDLYQWGLIGLYNAVLKFDETRGKSFYIIADYYIKSSIKTAVTTANRRKQEVLNTALSLYHPWQNDAKSDDDAIVFHLTDPSAHDPLKAVVEQENIQYVLEVCQSVLSKAEMEVMHYYLTGYKQRQIAQKMGVDSRVVDNAIQRARRKLTLHLEQYNKVV